jgi:hypothetical protein
MSTDNMENYQEIKNMIDYVNDTPGKVRISSVVRRWKKAIYNINKKYSKPRLKMTPLVRFHSLPLDFI